MVGITMQSMCAPYLYPISAGLHLKQHCIVHTSDFLTLFHTCRDAMTDDIIAQRVWRRVVMAPQNARASLLMPYTQQVSAFALLII